jgi:hypothetical protein
MEDQIVDIGGVRALVLADDGPQIAKPADASDVIGAAMSARVLLAVVPISRLSLEFFRLASGLAGEVLQKFVNYQIRIALLGDIAAHLEASNALRDFVRESNRGTSVWFLPDIAALEAKLRPA